MSSSDRSADDTVAIIREFVAGRSVREAAASLSITAKTVARHYGLLFARLAEVMPFDGNNEPLADPSSANEIIRNEHNYPSQGIFLRNFFIRVNLQQHLEVLLAVSSSVSKSREDSRARSQAIALLCDDICQVLLMTGPLNRKADLEDLKKAEKWFAHRRVRIQSTHKVGQLGEWVQEAEKALKLFNRVFNDYMSLSIKTDHHFRLLRAMIRKERTQMKIYFAIEEELESDILRGIEERTCGDSDNASQTFEKVILAEERDVANDIFSELYNHWHTVTLYGTDEEVRSYQTRMKEVRRDHNLKSPLENYMPDLYWKHIAFRVWARPYQTSGQ